MGATHTTRRLWLVATLATLATVAIFVVTIATRTGQLVGELILGGRPLDPADLQDLRGALSSLNIGTLVVGALLIGLLALLQGRPRLALGVLVIVVASNVTTQVLKTVVIERTDLLGGLFYVLPNSFPSGHATAAASLAAALILVIPPSVRAPIGTIATLVAVGLGVATISTGWHRMADALGGIFIAVAWAGTVGAVLGMWRGTDAVGGRTARVSWLMAVITVAVGTILLLGAVGAYVVVAADPLDVLSTLAERGGSPALYTLGVALTVGGGLMAFGGLSWALSVGHLDRTARPAPVVPAEAAPSST